MLVILSRLLASDSINRFKLKQSTIFIFRAFIIDFYYYIRPAKVYIHEGFFFHTF